MAIYKLTDIEIAVRIVPTRVRWPATGTSVAWTRAQSCVDALQDLVRKVDVACLEAEQNRQFSATAIARRRAELCDRALSELANFRSFEIAEKALSENIDALERLSDQNHQQIEMHRKLTQALRDLREGIEATRRMVMDRCRMRERVY